MTLFALSSFVNLQQGEGNHLLKMAGAKTQCHGNKGIISPGRSHRIQFIFNSLPSLVAVAANLIHGIPAGDFLPAFPAFVGILQKLIIIFIVALLSVGPENLIYLRYREPAVLLRRRTQDDIAHDVKGGIQSLWFVIPDITHLETAL